MHRSACACRAYRLLQGALAASLLTTSAVGYPAIVDWDGGGAIDDWNVALNWSTDALPTAGDDVRNATGGPILHRAGVHTINSLESDGNFVLSGGTLRANTPGASTFRVDASFLVTGGTLRGFVVQPGTGGQGITIANTRAKFFDAITSNAAIDMASGPSLLRVFNGLSLNAALSLNRNSLLSFQNTQALTGDAEIVFGNSGPGNRIAIERGATLTLGSEVLVHGVNGTIGRPAFAAGANRLVNQGRIDADGGGTIALSLNNRAQDAIVNDNLLQASNGVLVLGSNVTNRTNGKIVSDGATARVQQAGARITGGTIQVLNGGSFRPTNSTSNMLDGVSVQGDIDLSTARGMERILNDTTLDGRILLNKNSLLGFQSTGAPRTQLLTGDAEILLGNSGPGNRITIEGGTTLTLGSEVLVHGVNGTIGRQALIPGVNRLINQGRIDADGGGRITLDVNNRTANAVTNEGTLAATHGTLDVQDSIANSGNVVVGANGAMLVRRYAQSAGQTQVDGRLTVVGANNSLGIGGGLLTGDGIIAGNVILSGGTISAGASPGKLTVSGSFNQGLAASMLVEWGGMIAGLNYDFIDVNGTVTLNGGKVVVDILDGFTPAVGTKIAFLEFNRRVGSFGSVVGLDPGYAFAVTYGTNQAFLTVTQVPEAGTWAMFLAGLGLVAFSATRRAAHRG